MTPDVKRLLVDMLNDQIDTIQARLEQARLHKDHLAIRAYIAQGQQIEKALGQLMNVEAKW